MRKILIDDNLGGKIISLYNDGISPQKISVKIGGFPKEDTIRKYLKEKGVFKNLNYKYTDEDKHKIGSLYSLNKIDEIYDLYPNISQSTIYSIASKYGYKKESYFWLDDDVNYLIDNYHKYSLAELEKHYQGKHTKQAISQKANKLGLTYSNDWTDEENKIFKDNYSKVPMDEMLNLLPNRTYDAIIHRAKIFGLKSYRYINEKYSPWQKQFIKDNWQYMSDQEMADVIGKNARGVMEQRNDMGLFRINKEYAKYENLAKMFRGHIQEWKVNSMESCNYCCVFTGSKDFAIHHLYSFNYILKEAFIEIEKEIKLVSDQASDYSKEQLDRMIEIFTSIHNKYPLGVCIRKDIHNLFHLLYGSGGNTPEQWYQFEKDFKDGKYNDKVMI